MKKSVMCIRGDLLEIERVILKYRNYDHLLNQGLIFSYNRRYPLVDRVNIGTLYPTTYLSDAPQLPIYAAELVKSYIQLIHPSVKYKKLFRFNPMLPRNGINFLPYEDIDECIRATCSNITQDDLLYIGEILDNNIYSRYGELELPMTNIVHIDIDNADIVIDVGDDICAYRMKEAGYLK